MEIMLVIGKILFALLFIDAGINHFRYKDNYVAYTRQKGLPLPELGVVATGFVLIFAPILFIFKIVEVYSLFALSLFLFLTCILFHPFWKEKDINNKNVEKQAFYKNMSLLGLMLVVISLL